ncbi:MAG: hypothetical protein NC111_00615 [Bacteroides sp.]|nr:hypothetical protein [Bacteroides sp.]MCM1414154.1 hypothetical protein [Bacteroides sp.]MCM1471020.1 hypothetical protein [Bacteroides sp.]
MKKSVLTSRAALFNFAVAMFIAVTGMVIISSCGSSSSMSNDDYHRAGYTIGALMDAL